MGIEKVLLTCILKKVQRYIKKRVINMFEEELFSSKQPHGADPRAESQNAYNIHNRKSFEIRKIYI